jgi:hypothetical protein
MFHHSAGTRLSILAAASAPAHAGFGFPQGRARESSDVVGFGSANRFSTVRLLDQGHSACLLMPPADTGVVISHRNWRKHIFGTLN